MTFAKVLLVLLSLVAVWWRVVRVGRGFGVGVWWLHWFGASSAFSVGLVMFGAMDAGGVWHMLTLLLLGGVAWLWLDDAMGAIERWARPTPTPTPEAAYVAKPTNVSFLHPMRQVVRPKVRLDPIHLPDRVAFTYNSRDTGTKHRVVSVNKVHTLSYPPKFTGWCELSNSLKTFRVDRIEGDVVRQDTGEVLVAADWFKAIRAKA